MLQQIHLGRPAGPFGHSEQVGGGEVVAVFQLGSNVFIAGIARKQLVVGVAQALGERPNSTYRQFVQRCASEKGLDVIGWN